MEKDEKFNKVVEIMEKAEIRPKTEEHLRIFLFKLLEEAEFDSFVNILEKSPEAFDIFATIFHLKRTFFEYGGNQDNWTYILHKEQELIDLLNQSQIQAQPAVAE